METQIFHHAKKLNLQKYPLKETKNPSNISSFKNPHIKKNRPIIIIIIIT
jgi:hypothetical protein